MSTPYRANEPRIVHEVIDGEAVIVDLESGTYFSLRGSGAIVWEVVSRGGTTEDAVEVAARAFVVDAEAADAISNLVDELVAAGLVVPAPERRGGETTVHPGERLDFDTPVLERFTDMEDLLLLDPVHNVDERGWPHAGVAP